MAAPMYGSRAAGNSRRTSEPCGSLRVGNTGMTGMCLSRVAGDSWLSPYRTKTGNHLSALPVSVLGEHSVLGGQEDGALEAIRSQRGRHDHVGIHDEPEPNHPRFGFCARVALITSSIWRDVSLSVLFLRDSSRITLRTSGSGAASRT